MKLDVVVPATASRCQVVKFQVSPGCTATVPVGCGVLVRSRASEKAPVEPEFRTCPGPT